jgi:hypothetical protein
MNDRIKIYLDFIPLLILLVSVAILLWNVYSSLVGLLWKHYLGLILLLTTFILFLIRHRLGVLMLGLVLLLGLCGLLSYSPGITSMTLSFEHFATGASGTSPKFQPIFLLWLTIHFIVSGRHYFGILTKAYWKKL